jgi:adenylosuccinate synthase
VIGNGVVVDPTALFTEIDTLAAEGIDVDGRILVSDRAHVILPYHRDIEAAAERARGDRPIGTTSRGIGPSYEDKAGRRGVRVGDLGDHRPDGLLAGTLKANVAARNLACEGEPLAWESVHADLVAVWGRLGPLVTDASQFLHEAAAGGRRILFEGAQGTMLDVDHGTYPFVSSSNGTVGGVCTGLGVGPRAIGGVLGIVKAYTTRVGEGPFPTELLNEEGDALRESGQEYGASTGRPRRCGWFDSVVARYAARVNSLDTLALTKLDVLDDVDEVKICVGYQAGDQRLSEFPADPAVLAECTPEYETMPGWSAPTAGMTRFDDLPVEARRYVNRLEELSGVPIAIVSTGSGRGDTIFRDGSLVSEWLG